MNRLSANSLLRIFLHVAGGNSIRQALFACGNLYVAHQVSGSAFGVVGVGFSIYLIAAGLVDFGGRLYFWRRLARAYSKQCPRLAGLYLLSRFVLGLPICVILLVGCVLWSEEGGPGLLMAGYVVAAIFAQAGFDWVLLAQERVVRLSLFNSIAGLIFIFGLVVFVNGDGDIIWFPICLGISYGIAAFVCILPIVELRNLTPRRVKIATFSSLRSRSNYAGFDLLQRLHTGYMTMLLVLIGGYAFAGQWRVAQIGYQLIVTLGTYAGYAAFTRIVRDKFNMRIAVSRLLPAILCSIPIVGILAGLMYMGTRWLIGQQYTAGGEMLGILVGGAAATAVGVFIRETLVAEGLARRAYVALSAVILVASLITWVASVWGLVYAPALAVVVAELLVLCVLLQRERIVRSVGQGIGWLGGGIAHLGAAACSLFVLHSIIGA